MITVTSAAGLPSAAPEEKAIQKLRAFFYTDDGRLARYVQAAADIPANTACVVLADGTCALTGSGLAAKSDYAIPNGSYGLVIENSPQAV